MGLFAGMHVRVAFLTEDGEKNTFREFLLTKNSLTEIDAEPRFQIPAELLRQAKIAEDADIQMIVVDGAILICQEPNLNVQELKQFRFAWVMVASMTELPNDLPAQRPLQQAPLDFMDEEMSSNEYDTGPSTQEKEITETVIDGLPFAFLFRFRQRRNSKIVKDILKAAISAARRHKGGDIMAKRVYWSVSCSRNSRLKRRIPMPKAAVPRICR